MCCRRTAESSPNSPARSVLKRRCSTPPRRFTTRPRRKAMPKKMSGRCMRSWRAAPACRRGNEEGEMRRADQMLSAAQRDAYERDGFIVVPDVFSPAEIDELRRVTDQFVRNAAAVTANDEVYD